MPLISCYVVENPATLDSLYFEVKRMGNLLAETKIEIKKLKEENRTLTRVRLFRSGGGGGRVAGAGAWDPLV